MKLYDPATVIEVLLHDGVWHRVLQRDGRSTFKRDQNWFRFECENAAPATSEKVAGPISALKGVRTRESVSRLAQRALQLTLLEEARQARAAARAARQMAAWRAMRRGNESQAQE